MKKSVMLLHTGFLALALLTGCGTQSAPTPADGHDHHGHTSNQQQLANGDLQELTASINTLPTFLDNVDPQIKEVYKIAGENWELLQWIPCYCGCGESAGHLHNGNCFIKEVKADSSVVWDDHGTRCGTCLEIAYVSAQMKAEGKSVKEIRTFIDNAYKDGYAPPTPTPMPS